MSDYGADSPYNQAEGVAVGINYGFIDPADGLSDQFTIDAEAKVFKFCSGDKRTNIKIKYNPTELVW